MALFQAQDRAFRIGQTRDVKVYRLMGTGCIEEQVYCRQVYKQQIANQVIDKKDERRYVNQHPP
jgi:DNA excision repair protein ERCC-6-like 2